MSRLLIVEDSIIVQALFKELLDASGDFLYDIASSYAEAREFLSKKRYEFGVVERVLKDAPNGEIIALFNKHYLAPLVFTNRIDESFFDDFEGAQIVDYVKKVKYNNEAFVIKKLQQLQTNKKRTVLVVSASMVYSSYLKQNLNLHSFKVFNAYSSEEAYEKISLHPEISLLIIDSNKDNLNSMKVVEYARAEVSKELKIIVLSEETNSYYTSSLLNSGADDYLIKDFSRDEFYVRVYQNINKVS